VTVKFADLAKAAHMTFDHPQPVRDLWFHRDLPSAAGSFSATVPRHGVVFVKIGTPK